MKPRDEETTFEPIRKTVGNGAPSQANKGRIKRKFKSDRHLEKKKRR